MTSSMLAAANPQEQKQMLGERLFPLIQVNIKKSENFSENPRIADLTCFCSKWPMLILLAKSLACCLKLTILSCYTCWTIGSCSSQRSTKPYWSCSIINKTQVEVIESNDRQAKVRNFDFLSVLGEN